MDCFAALAMTAACCKHDSAFSRRIAPELCTSFRPSMKRAQGMPGAGWHPRSRVQIALGDAHTSIQVQPEQPGIPCAMGLRLIPCSPWRRIPLASIADGLTIPAARLGPTNLHQLDTSHGCQNHTALPSATAPFVGARPSLTGVEARPTKTCLRARRSAATAPRTQRP